MLEVLDRDDLNALFKQQSISQLAKATGISEGTLKNYSSGRYDYDKLSIKTLQLLTAYRREDYFAMPCHLLVEDKTWKELTELFRPHYDLADELLGFKLYLLNHKEDDKNELRTVFIDDLEKATKSNLFKDFNKCFRDALSANVRFIIKDTRFETTSQHFVMLKQAMSQLVDVYGLDALKAIVESSDHAIDCRGGVVVDRFNKEVKESAWGQLLDGDRVRKVKTPLYYHDEQGRMTFYLDHGFSELPGMREWSLTFDGLDALETRRLKVFHWFDKHEIYRNGSIWNATLWHYVEKADDLSQLYLSDDLVMIIDDFLRKDESVKSLVTEVSLRHTLVSTIHSVFRDVPNDL